METYFPCQLSVASIDKGITKTEIPGLNFVETRCAIDCSPITTEMDGESSCFAEANLPILNGRLCRVTEECTHLANELNALL